MLFKVMNERYYFEDILDRKVKSLQKYLQKPRQLLSRKEIKQRIKSLLNKCVI